MPKPIRMTETMIEESFADLRKDFEAAYAKAYAAAKAGAKLADGKFDFKYSGINWTWKDDKSKAKLTITSDAYLKMSMLVQSTDKEVAWHGIIERDPEDKFNFILKDIFLFPQKVTAATVVTDDDKYAEWVMSLDDETFNKCRFHGHSHVNMAVNPSSTDMTYRADMLGQFNDGFYVFLIINKKEDVSGQIYDFDNNILFDTSEIDFVLGGDMLKQLKEDTKKFVEPYVYRASYGTGSASKPKNETQHAGYNGGYDRDGNYYNQYGGRWDSRLGRYVYGSEDWE